MCSSCLVIADFNGDGKPDIAYAYEAQLPFSGVALGNGDGTFRPGATFNVSEYAGSILIGDFNGDGKADVAYSGASGSVIWIAFGNGDGTFQSRVMVNACRGVSAVADVNRDGKTDLICGTSSGLISSVLLSNGDGTFRGGSTVNEAVMLAADFNHDGNPDLLLHRVSGQLAVTLGRGDGTFGTELPVSTMLTGPITADFNGDGQVDLAGVCTKVGLICVLPGIGDGTFGPAIQTSVASSLPGQFTATADFNGDGKIDLVAANAVFAGNGDGTFQPPVFLGPVASPCSPNTEVPLLDSCGLQPVAAVAADFNGDGLPDLALGTDKSGGQGFVIPLVTVLLNDSPGDGLLTPGVSSASYTWPVAPGSIVSAFGVNLATAKESAEAGSLPTTLGGIRVHVRDNSTGDRLAQLLYVSPTQINYVMPSSDPFPWIGIEHVGTPYVPKGIAVPVSPIAGGFYVLGAGLAAGNAITVAPNGTQTIVPATSCSGTVCNSVPIDLSGAPVYLSLYGTGFAQAAAAASNCSIAGQTLPLSYAGPQMEVVGLDQVNLLLPKSLAGTGATSISCLLATAAVPGAGIDSVFSATNAVQLTIR